MNGATHRLLPTLTTPIFSPVKKRRYGPMTTLRDNTITIGSTILNPT